MFHHLAIQVRDLPLVERFYTQTLGLTVLRRWPATDGASVDRSVWLERTDGSGEFLALERAPAGEPTAAEDPARATRPGLHLIALVIERSARDAWERRLADAGVAVEARTAFTLYVRDPEGNRVGLSHWPDSADDGARS
jgi:catechol 2,3-dioxygenase-like lactoylglutathione lyase family enzyme